MNQQELNKILELHKKWLADDPDGECANLSDADLSEANLRCADLRIAHLRGTDLKGADLRGADLRSADLKGADLRGANLDFSCWPLHCGSKDVKLDVEQVKQLLMHVVWVDCPEFNGKLRNDIKEFIKDAAVIKRHGLEIK